MKVALILTASSGTGKSTLAESLKSLNPSEVEICTADDYFTNDVGEYEFNPSELSQAHKSCQEKFCKALGDKIPLVICANTNTRKKDVDYYKSRAEEFGYIVFNSILMKTHENEDVHGVPSSVKTNQIEQISNLVSERLKI